MEEIGAAWRCNSCKPMKDIQKETQCLKFLQLNINGIWSKKHELESMLEENEISVAFIQETKLSKKSNFQMFKYNVIRRDRDSHGGGICTLIRKDLRYAS